MRYREGKETFKVGGWKYRLFGRLVSIFSPKFRISFLYFMKIGRIPRLRAPVSLTEKIQWRKLYDYRSEFAILADKIASKEYVKSRAPQVIIPKMLWQGDRVEDLDFRILPSDYVVKANHGSKMNLIVRGGRHPSPDVLRKYFSSWRKHNQSAVLDERAYGDIVPRFFVEEYLDWDGDEPADYKCFVYGGRVEYIQVDTGRFDCHCRNIMARRWRDTGIRYSHPMLVPSPEIPGNLDEIIGAAEDIARGFDFLRVDLYSDGRRVYFGEITVYPGAGYEKFARWEDDLLLGEKWHVR